MTDLEDKSVKRMKLRMQESCMTKRKTISTRNLEAETMLNNQYIQH